MAANKKSRAVVLPEGSVFGRLTVVGFAGTRRGVGIHKCICECGREMHVVTCDLTAGETTSCARGKCHYRWKGGRAIFESPAWFRNRISKIAYMSRQGGYAEPYESWHRVRELWEQCGGKCACCKQKEKGKASKSLHLDHCHTTGKLRGFICARCNHILGWAGDSPDVLARISKYAVKHQQRTLTFAEEGAA